MAKATSGSEKPAKKTRSASAAHAGSAEAEQSAASKPAAKKTAATPKKATASAAPAKTAGRGKASASTADTAVGGASADGGSGRKAAAKTAKASGGAAAKKTAAAGSETSAGAKRGGAAAKADGQPDLRAHMRDFASARADGWGHDDWLSFLDELHGRGHDVSDHHAIGRQLEGERLSLTLERVPELKPRQVSALVERFETLWSLRNAQASELASVPGISEDLAERVLQAVRQG